MDKNLVMNRKGEMVERRQWLKEIRKEKGLTVRQAAAEIGLSWSFYSDIENSRRTPSLKNAAKIANFYGISTDKFIS